MLRREFHAVMENRGTIWFEWRTPAVPASSLHATEEALESSRELFVTKWKSVQLTVSPILGDVSIVKRMARPLSMPRQLAYYPLSRAYFQIALLFYLLRRWLDVPMMFLLWLTATVTVACHAVWAMGNLYHHRSNQSTGGCDNSCLCKRGHISRSKP